jgi:hypothetical protein
MARQPLGGLGRLIVRDFTITLRHTTVGRTPLDEGTARRRDLYLTTHNTHKRQTSMPSARFEPTIPVSERPQTYALDRAATGIGILIVTNQYSHISLFSLFLNLRIFLLDCLTAEYGTARLSRNVGNYHSTLRNIPEERRSNLHRGGSLKSRLPTFRISISGSTYRNLLSNVFPLLSCSFTFQNVFLLSTN